ncbi:carbohydrate binding domain-containing protein [Roseomonas elaeocarpi]|uniref:CBM-cenC domain-containing protein n=1 Tax=Roseomonas elaeocarpi TaxID=907779 RepID=A0ABV6JYY6_9PROT
MPALISGATNLIDAASTVLAADGALGGLGVENLRTSILGEVWRTSGTVEAQTSSVVSTDSANGAVLGANTTRTGNVANHDGTSNAAVAYSNSATSNASVGTTAAVKGGQKYRVQVWVRRANGASVSGNAILVVNAATAAFGLPMSNLAQGTAWQLLTLDFTAQRTGTANLYFVTDTGTLSYALDGATLYALPTYAVGSKSARLAVDLGAAMAVDVVAFGAPFDGLRPPAGSLVRICASNQQPFGVEVLDTGALDFAMTRDGWSYTLPAAKSARYWWAQINVPAAQAYLQLGRAWLGGGVRPARNPSAENYQPGADDSATTAPLRRMQFSIASLSEAEAVAIESLGLDAGTQRQVLVVHDTTRPARSTIFGKFTAIPAPRLLQQWDARGQLSSVDIAIKGDR